MAITLEQLNDRIGIDYLIDICTGLSIEAKEQYEDDDPDLARIYEVREFMKVEGINSVKTAIARMNGEPEQPKVQVQQRKKRKRKKSAAIERKQRQAPSELSAENLAKLDREETEADLQAGIALGVRKADRINEGVQLGCTARLFQNKQRNQEALVRGLLNSDTAAYNKADVLGMVEAAVGELEPSDEGDALAGFLESSTVEAEPIGFF